MKSSLKVRDEEDDEFYPDVLSLSYEGGRLTKIPAGHTMTRGDISKFWKYFYENYEMTELDDILLNANGWPYLGLAEPGDVLCEIAKEDLTNYIEMKREGYEEE